MKNIIQLWNKKSASWDTIVNDRYIPKIYSDGKYQMYDTLLNQWIEHSRTCDSKEEMQDNCNRWFRITLSREKDDNEHKWDGFKFYGVVLGIPISFIVLLRILITIL